MNDIVTPPPPPAAPSSASEALGSPPPAPAFYESFQDAGAKEYATKAGWKSAEDAVKYAAKFDALKDTDLATVRALPKADDPNAFVAFARENLGAPTEAAAYGLDKLEGVDADLAGAAAGWFQEAGLTPFQAQHVAAKQMAFAKAQAENLAKEEKASAEREMTQLRDEWKGEYDGKLEMARRAAKALGATKEEMDYLESGMGAGAVLKLFERASKFFKESDFVDGEYRPPEVNDISKRWYPNT